MPQLCLLGGGLCWALSQMHYQDSRIMCSSRSQPCLECATIYHKCVVIRNFFFAQKTPSREGRVRYEDARGLGWGYILRKLLVCRCQGTWLYCGQLSFFWNGSILGGTKWMLVCKSRKKTNKKSRSKNELTPVSCPMWLKMYWRPSASWKASTFPSRYCNRRSKRWSPALYSFFGYEHKEGSSPLNFRWPRMGFHLKLLRILFTKPGGCLAL